MSERDKEYIQKEAQRYAVMASVLLGSGALGAQVRYVDIPDLTLDQNGQTLDLNLDSDTNGVVDYRIIQYVDTTQFLVSGSFIQARGTARNQVVGLDYANYYYPFKLDLGMEIGADTIFRGLGTSLNWGQLGLAINDTTYPNDQFSGGVSDGFIGLRFGATLNDTLRRFYGWIRVDVAADLKSITIKDYAYQSQADSSILAGEGSPLLREAEWEASREEWQVWQNGPMLHWQLPQDEEAAELCLRDLQGRKLRVLSLEGNRGQIPLPPDLPKGVVSAELHRQGLRQQTKLVLY